jgi:hypothetical protein
VLWWFEREGQRTTIEVLQLPTGEFELRIVDNDGVERIEHFANSTDLATRQQAIQDALVEQGWKRTGEWML